MRNMPFSETELIQAALRSLYERLPPAWSAKQDKTVARTAKTPDAMIVIKGPDGRSAKVAVEVKKMVEPRNIPQLVERLKSCPADAIIVVAPFIGSRARDLFKERGCGYADSTGNFWLRLNRPGLFVETTGATKDPTPLERPLRSLRGSATGRAVRALCDFRPPVGVRELAQRAQVPAATLSRVIDLLVREALIQQDERGTVVRLDWQGTIRRWSDDYSFVKSNRVRTFLQARGIAALREKLDQVPWIYAVTGSLAASRIASVAAPRLVQIYVKDARVAAKLLELKEVEAGANVMLAEPFNDVVFERTAKREGMTCAALAQVAVDLLTSPGRAPEEAEALFKWMVRNEDAWRA